MADETKTDTDDDGLSDAVERQLGTNINKADSDGDGRIDGFEVAVGQPRVRDLSITDPAGSAAIVDDLVTDLEQIIGVTKHNVDSDGDGFADWVEEMRGGTDRKRGRPHTGADPERSEPARGVHEPSPVTNGRALPLRR